MDELLKALKANARTSPADLAKMLDLSEADIRAKIKEYEQNGTIRGYQAIVNDDRLDIDGVQAVIEVRITPEREGGFDRVASRIGKFPEVESLFLMSGSYDLLVFLNGKNLRESAAFVSEKLATIDGVISTATHFMLKTYKVNGIAMEKDEQDERLKISP